MGQYNWRKAKAIENDYKKKLLKVDPTLKDESGIYFLTRTDEFGFKFAYIGQAGGYRTDSDGNTVEVKQGVLTRLAQHCMGHSQHIDLSLKKWKLYDKDTNPYGWNVHWKQIDRQFLNEHEQHYIKLYADAGYQLRNVSRGSQSSGRDMIGETKPRKGYREGTQQGYNNALKDLGHFLSTHCFVSLKKPNNKVSRTQAEKWKDWIHFENM